MLLLSQFLNSLLSYCTRELRRSNSCLSASSLRHENQASKLEKCCQTFLNSDKVENFEDLIEKLPEELYCQKYLLHERDSGDFLIHLFEETPPSLLATIFINTNLDIAIYHDQALCYRLLTKKKTKQLCKIKSNQTFQT